MATETAETTKPPRRAWLPWLLVALVVLLLAGTTTAVVAAQASDSAPPRAPGWMMGRVTHETCAAPNLPGSVVRVTLASMGGSMMGGPMMGGSMMGGRSMRLVADRTTVAAGKVSFVASNVSAITHELVVLPLAPDQAIGDRPVGGDGRVAETGSLGEASKTCGAGAGEGLTGGSAGWVTLDLAPGRYELVCNLPGHYAAGMYSQLTVS